MQRRKRQQARAARRTAAVVLVAGVTVVRFLAVTAARGCLRRRGWRERDTGVRDAQHHRNEVQHHDDVSGGRASRRAYMAHRRARQRP